MSIAPSRLRHPLRLVFALSVAIGLAGCSGLGSTSPPPSPDESGPSSTDVTPTTPPATPEESTVDRDTAITITLADTVLQARLRDSPPAQQLIAQLPLTLEFRDFNSVEKIAQLPRPLTMDGVPEGDDPRPQDIGYYAPSGDLVLYYGDVGYFAGIVRLGEVVGDISVIRDRVGPFDATIDLADVRTDAE